MLPAMSKSLGINISIAYKGKIIPSKSHITKPQRHFF